MKIVTCMSVAGHDRYFDFAKWSIPTFLHNCPRTELLVFTDRVDAIKALGKGNPRLHALDFKRQFDSVRMERVKALSKFNQSCPSYFDSSYNHNHILVAALLPMAHAYAVGHMPGVTHILKVDCDAFFAGGDLMASVEADVREAPAYDLWLVDRSHPLMGKDGMGRPGVGFTLWTVDGAFMPAYLSTFTGEEQKTILIIRRNMRTRILPRPGYHFVFPFHAGHARVAYKREQLKPFLPAYFHVHLDAEFQLLEEWFGGVK